MPGFKSMGSFLFTIMTTKPWTRPPTAISIPKPGSAPVENPPDKRKTRRKKSDPDDDTSTRVATYASLKREKRVYTSTPINAQEERATALVPIEMDLAQMSHSKFKEIFVWKTVALPVYTGPRVGHNDSRPVSFPKHWQFSMAERDKVLQDHIYELLPAWKTRKEDLRIFFFPGRHFFVDDQHAVIMGPATQQSTSSIKLTSPFEKMYGQTGHFFYTFGPIKNKQIFYAGTYQCIKLADHYPQGFVYSGGNLVLKELAKEIVESQTEGPRLRIQDAIKLLREKKIVLEFVMFQLVGFQMDFYHILTSQPNAGSTRKRKRDSEA